MNNELIPVFESEINDELTPTINARDLHKFLEIGRDFSTWIKVRISEYGFSQDVDYILCSPVVVSTTGSGTPRIDYHLTLDMAKELAMVERNSKGKEARKYFIQCEKQLLNNTNSHQMVTLQNMIANMATAINTLTSEVTSVKALVLAQKPKVDMYEQVMAAHNSLDMEAVAKVISDKLGNGKTIGKYTMLKHLRNKKILTKTNLPIQKFVDTGYFEVRINKYQCSNGKIAVYPQAMATPKGINAIFSFLKSNNIV